MRIATWNVNSIKQRIENTVAWLRDRAPDIVCLQEIKCVDEAFPREPFEALGYNVAVHGQKTYNGVAILSKLPLEQVRPRLAGDDSDAQARFLEATVSIQGGALRVACLYLPNGNPPLTDKYAYKIKWMNRLIAYSHERLAHEEAFVLAGDFNVIRRPPMPATRRRGRATPCSCRRRASASARWPTLASPTPSAPSATMRASTRSGTIRPALGKRTTASASTT